MTGALPDPPAGTVAGRRRDAWRIWWWQVRGKVFQAGRPAATVWERIGAALSAAMLTVLAPVAIAAVAVLASPRRNGSRYYFTPGRDACMAVLAGRKGWTVADHLCSRPGTGQGAALRAVLCPALLAAADRQQVSVRLDASSARLASMYRQAFPGLVDEGRAWPYGRRLSRTPPGRPGGVL